MSLSDCDDLDAIRERSRVWAERNALRHRIPSAGRASRDRQILLRAIDFLLADRRVTCPIEIDSVVDGVANEIHSEVVVAQRKARP